MLIDNGADYKITDNYFTTALGWAVAKRQTKVVNYLRKIQFGISYDDDVSDDKSDNLDDLDDITESNDGHDENDTTSDDYKGFEHITLLPEFEIEDDNNVYY